MQTKKYTENKTYTICKKYGFVGVYERNSVQRKKKLWMNPVMKFLFLTPWIAIVFCRVKNNNENENAMSFEPEGTAVAGLFNQFFHNDHR